MIAPRFAYRLTEWPDLAPAEKTAPVLRAFSRMTLGPVTAAWFVANSRMEPARASRLLQRLADAGALERIDFGPAPVAAAAPEPDEARSPARAATGAWTQAARNCAAAATLAMLAMVSSDQSVAKPLACRSPLAAAGGGVGS